MTNSEDTLQNGDKIVSHTESVVSHVPMMDFTISHTNLFKDAIRVVQYFFTTWRAEELELEQCKGGITNNCSIRLLTGSDFGYA